MQSNDSFSSKLIDVEFTFSDTGKTLSISGHRVACIVTNGGLQTGVMCSLRIEGMSQSNMNSLSVIQAGLAIQSSNTVTVKAGDAGGMNLLFQGGITEAFIDYANSPNIAFVVMALSMALPAAVRISSTSYPNGASVSDICQTIAGKAGLSFQNNSVISYLGGSLYFWGTAAQQLDAVGAASRISYNIALNTLSIYAPGYDSKQSSIEISASTGMIGYPAYSQYFVNIKTLFNPAIGFGDIVTIKSDYVPSEWVNGNGQVQGLAGSDVKIPYDGKWQVARVDHSIQSETPDGAWETDIVAVRPNIAGSTAFRA